MGLFDRFRGAPRARVRMIASVGDHVAGEQYDLPVDIADRYLARGYAAGDFSRHYEAHELHALRGNSQVVSL
jgi:hypothetical protein